MNTETFKERWTFKEHELGTESLSTEFVQCGETILPRDAAPCLSFDEAAKMRRIWEIFGIPAHWSDSERTRLGNFRAIGFDGAGNPICIEDTSKAIWLLDHEDRFQSRQFVNSGITQLAECLLAYMEHFADKDANGFRADAFAIDASAMGNGNFWWHEATALEHDTE